MKVGYASYPDSEAQPGVSASAGRALELRPWLRDQGHELVATSETEAGLDAELEDAEVLVTTPFWP